MSLVAKLTAAMPVLLPVRVTVTTALPLPSPAITLGAPNCTCDGGVWTGSQSGNQSSSELLVSFARLLLLAFITNNSTVVSSAMLPEAKTIFEPSKDHAGKPSVTVLLVSRV